MAVAPPPPPSSRTSANAHLNLRAIAEELLGISRRALHLAEQIQQDADDLQATIKRLADNG